MRRILAAAWHWLLPETAASLSRGRAGLVLATCLGLAGASGALVLTWRISGDLEGETVIAGGVFTMILAGIGALARAGKDRFAAWLLTGLLLLLIAADAASYGLGSPAAAGFFIPVLLATCALGFAAGMGVAVFAAAVIWGIAWATTTGLYAPWGAVDISHLTFNAPALTVMLLVGALIVGLWIHHLAGLTQK